jgi:predicted ATPase
VPARRLLGVGEGHRAAGRAESNLVGRRWELSAVEGLLDRAIDGHGAVVGVVGSPGIGKSRLVREVAAIARRRNVEVFTTFCESHATDVPFRVVARVLRTATGVEGLDAQAARAQVHARVRDADPEDLALFDDLLGIADPEVVLPSCGFAPSRPNPSSSSCQTARSGARPISGHTLCTPEQCSTAQRGRCRESFALRDEMPTYKRPVSVNKTLPALSSVLPAHSACSGSTN